MLSEYGSSIADISQLVGFCNQSYFGEMFHVLTGMTQRAYRQRFRARIWGRQLFASAEHYRGAAMRKYTTASPLKVGLNV